MKIECKSGATALIFSPHGLKSFACKNAVLSGLSLCSLIHIQWFYQGVLLHEIQRVLREAKAVSVVCLIERNCFCAAERYKTCWCYHNYSSSYNAFGLRKNVPWSTKENMAITSKHVQLTTERERVREEREEVCDDSMVNWFGLRVAGADESEFPLWPALPLFLALFYYLSFHLYLFAYVCLWKCAYLYSLCVCVCVCVCVHVSFC